MWKWEPQDRIQILNKIKNINQNSIFYNLLINHMSLLCYVQVQIVRLSPCGLN